LNLTKNSNIAYNQENQRNRKTFMTEYRVQDSINYYKEKEKELFQEFLKFLQIPSISTASEHEGDIQQAADYLVKKIASLGFKNVKAIPTTRHPIVYGEYLPDPNKPTLLIYGHYDVQPPAPLDEWDSQPFEPQIRGEHLYARGASDMKGQIWALISALESTLKTGKLPLNIKFLIEGEEEIGSPSLDSFLANHRPLLASDFVLNTDAGMIAPDKPTIVYGLRGLAYFELIIHGPKADLHSGQFGGVIDNPAKVLSHLIAKMHDSSGRVTLPGFYDQVRELTPEERENLASLGLNEGFYKQISGAPALGGESGFTPVERISARPTLDVNGLYAGYIEQGAKTIIPAYAMAKISTRLVPDQVPSEVHQSLRAFLEENVPETVTWELEFMSGAPAYINEEDVMGLTQFKEALQNTWGVKPFLKREGGSIPVATAMKDILGIDSIITGFGLPDDQIHSPNERVHLPTHKKGVEALIRFFVNF
jgi:acetylornithine deacetylase/succinyl-diaminopimelate desuccinylase-like protein